MNLSCRSPLHGVAKGFRICFVRMLIISACLLWAHPASADSGIIGTWSGLDSDGDAATIVFEHNNRAEIKLEGVPRLSSDTVVNGSVRWAGELAADPMKIDVVIIRADREVGRIPLIARLQDQDTLVIQFSRDMTTRPRSFEISAEVFQVVAKKERHSD